MTNPRQALPKLSERCVHEGRAERLRVSPDGQVVLELRRRWANGTTHLVFDPVELLERLAALVPRPRINLVLYHGVLAPCDCSGGGG